MIALGLHKKWLLLCLLLAAIPLAWWGTRRMVGAAMPVVRVLLSPARRSNFDFIPEHWREPRLRQLREGEDFREITGQTQLELFRKLADWTHRQWTLSVPDPYPPSNALDILREIRAGRTGGFCGQYAYVLADVLKSLGFFCVRYVELWQDSGRSHFVVEVWLDSSRKWIVLDPTDAVYYVLTASGQPAGALEIHRSLRGGEKVSVLPLVPGGAVPDPEDKVRFYARFAVSLRSDLMRHEKPLTVRERFDTFLFLADGQGSGNSFPGGFFYRNASSRVEDLYWDCNLCRVESERGGDSVRLTFHTDGTTPNFRGFLVSRDGGRSWQANPGSFEVGRAQGDVRLWVTPVNWLDRPGVITPVQITWN